MAKSNNIRYDPVEVVLIAVGPYVGLELEDRFTALDIKTIAQGDHLLNPVELKPKDGVEALFWASMMTQEQIAEVYDGVPVLRRRGTFTRQWNKYRLLFRILGVENITNPDQVNAVIHDGNYRWTIDIYEYDETCSGKEGTGIFSIDIEKRTSQEGIESNIIDEYDLIDDYEGEDKRQDTGLVPKLRKLMEKYPIGSKIDPVQYTLEFLETITTS